MSDNQDDQSAEDDWGAAIAEQAKAEAEALQNQAANTASAASAAVFKDFSKQASKSETHNDIDFILDIVFEAYTKSWEPVFPVEFEYIRSEMNTQFANIATPNEVVVASTFTVELGSVSGQIHFCMPYSMIEPIRDSLTSSLQGQALEVDKRWIRLMTQQIQIAEVELVASLGTARV